MEDIKTVHYVTQDPLQNLKLNVTLTRLSAAKSKKQDACGQEGTSAAEDGASTAADGTQQHAAAARATGRPQPFKVTKTFSWQEKVYSKAELVAAQAQIRASQQRGAQFMSPKRNAHFGSQSHIGTDRLLTSSTEGSLLFSYVQTDDFCEGFETSKSITTSRWEGQNHLALKLLRDPRNRQKMLNFHAMFIMVDLGDEHTVAGSNEKVLCAIRAHRDGSFDMTPGFNQTGHKYRFEDDHGGIYEYVIEPASRSAAPSLEKRAAKLAGAVAAQAEELRRQNNRMDHMPPPGRDSNAVRLLLMAEVVSAAGFSRDRLYVEWQLHFDPELWVLQHSEQEVVNPGLIQGVTQVSQMVQYPADYATDTPAVWVAHFAHPIEVEWVAGSAPAPKDWPRLLLQVCTYDLWDRVTTEGYGWLQLGGICPGSSTHYVDTWKPLGKRRDQQQAFFIGGSEELEDMSYAAVPKGHKGSVLNKYGYKTQTSGTVKVRVHSVTQTGTSGGTSPRRAAANRRAAAASTRQHRELSLAVVLERARSRLQEARGGEVAVREGVVSQRPVVTVQPLDVSVNEGGTAQFTVTATGLGPLRYQWFKDSKRLTVATSSSPLLILVDVGANDSGSYHCQVSNKDGAVSSSKALLSITRIGRLQHATGAIGEEPGVNSSGEQMAASLPSISDTLTKRSTVPRSLARGGLPYSPRFPMASSSGAGSSPAASSRTSPLRTSLAGLSPVARRSMAAAAAAAAAANSGGGGGAGDDDGGDGGGGSSSSAGGSPFRRSLVAAPGLAATIAASGEGAVGGWTSAAGGTRSPLRRGHAAPAAAAARHEQPEQQQQLTAEAQQLSLQKHSDTAVDEIAMPAGQQQVAREGSGMSAASVGYSSSSGGDAIAGQWQTGAPAAVEAAASPIRAVARRSRVSEQ